MGNTIVYTIDGIQYFMNIDGSPPFFYGATEVLSNAYTDMTFETDWYEEGYTTLPFLGTDEFATLRRELQHVIEKIVASQGVNIDGFQIEKYHRFVTDDATHLAVVSRILRSLPGGFQHRNKRCRSQDRTGDRF